MATPAGKFTKAAAGAKIGSGRRPLTDKQREERSRRTTIRVQQQERRITETVKEGLRRQRTQESARLSRENREAVAARTRESSRLRREEIGIRNAASVQRTRDIGGIRRRERLTTELVEKPVTGGARPVVNGIFLVLTVFASLIIFYAIITSPQGFTGWLGGLGNFIATLSQNGPLFTKTQGTG